VSAIEPIDNRVRPVEPVRRPVRRNERDPEQQPYEEPRERKQQEPEQPSGGGLVDVRV
jgi:hypothetical protein